MSVLISLKWVNNMFQATGRPGAMSAVCADIAAETKAAGPYAWVLY